MTSRDDFDRHLAAWLTEVAPMREPEPLLGQVLARTARTRRRPAWRIPERWINVSAITTHAAPVSRFPLRTAAVAALLILALAAAALLYIGTQRRVPAPFGPAGNGHYAYGTGGDILVRDSLDGPARVLIGGSGFDVGPAFSNDGTRFSFLRFVDGRTDAATDLWLANADGSGQHRLAGPFDRPDWYEWSPAGDAIAVMSMIDGRWTLTVVPTDGARATRLDLGINAMHPMWRPPDGRQILFRGLDARGVPGLYLVDRDGSNPHKIGLDTGLAAGRNVDEDFFSEPTFSPDGTLLAFHSPQPDIASPQGEGPQVHVAAIGPAGEVLSDRTIAHAPGDIDYYASFLPQGDRIVFWRADERTTSAHVASVDAAGPATDLGCCPGADGKGGAMYRLLSPDGSRVLVLPSADQPMQSIDLATGARLDTGITFDDYGAWQRVAVP